METDSETHSKGFSTPDLIALRRKAINKKLTKKLDKTQPRKAGELSAFLDVLINACIVRKEFIFIKVEPYQRKIIIFYNTYAFLKRYYNLNREIKIMNLIGIQLR
jgi:hypothetical protein